MVEIINYKKKTIKHLVKHPKMTKSLSVGALRPKRKMITLSRRSVGAFVRKEKWITLEGDPSV